MATGAESVFSLIPEANIAASVIAFNATMSACEAGL
jgi:hypothetical protein